MYLRIHVHSTFYITQKCILSIIELLAIGKGRGGRGRSFNRQKIIISHKLWEKEFNITLRVINS